MAVRKLDDESSLLGLASDASNTGLGIFDRPGDSIRGVVTGDDTALSAARMPDALSGDEESGGAKLPTETLLWRIDLAGCCALSCRLLCSLLRRAQVVVILKGEPSCMIQMKRLGTSL